MSEIQETRDGETFRYRYRCSFCGHTGRWLRDGATATMYLRAHQGDSRERTPCPRLRNAAG